MEKLIELSLQLPALFAVGSCQQVGTLKKLADSRRLMVYVVLIPTQLQIILSVNIHSIRVCKGDIAHSV